MKRLITALTFTTLTLAGCVSTDYQFGDLSKNYCAATTPQGRALVKSSLIAVGIDVPVNYCATLGLVDMLINKESD